MRGYVWFRIDVIEDEKYVIHALWTKDWVGPNIGE